MLVFERVLILSWPSCGFKAFLTSGDFSGALTSILSGNPLGTFPLLFFVLLPAAAADELYFKGF